MRGWTVLAAAGADGVVCARLAAERAAEGEPANAVIAEHLGDVYWALGRRWEARYAWSGAAGVAGTADQSRLAAKIADGPGGTREATP